MRGRWRPIDGAAMTSSIRLIERAKDDGSLRRDVVPEDVVLLLMANAGVVQGTGAAAPEAWRRFVGLMLDGLRSDGATDIPPPPSPRQMMRAMRRLARPAVPARSN